MISLTLRVSYDVVEKAVAFGLQRKHCQLLDFGTKKVHMQDGEVIESPKIRRTISFLEIMQKYHYMKGRDSSIHRVGDTSS